MDEIRDLANRIECGTRALNIVAISVAEKTDKYAIDALVYMADALTKAAVQLSAMLDGEVAHGR